MSVRCCLVQDMIRSFFISLAFNPYSQPVVTPHMGIWGINFDGVLNCWKKKMLMKLIAGAWKQAIVRIVYRIGNNLVLSFTLFNILNCCASKYNSMVFPLIDFGKIR